MLKHALVPAVLLALLGFGPALAEAPAEQAPLQAVPPVTDPSAGTASEDVRPIEDKAREPTASEADAKAERADGQPSGEAASEEKTGEETTGEEKAGDGEAAVQNGEQERRPATEVSDTPEQPDPPPPPPPFSFDVLTERARAQAGEPYEAEEERELPAEVADLDYDAYRDIRFRRDKALWRGERLYEVQLFHLGFLYRRPVDVNVVVDGQVQPVPFSSDLFDYGRTEVPSGTTEDLGFAGFRLHYPLHHGTYKDEVLAFLGASYFRLLGRRQIYGISTRGLAVDTALPSGEEFPYFTEFWLERPEPEQVATTVYAMLESRRVVGAYRFIVTPGTQTTVDVTARLFFRDDVGKLGVAPLTSMFYFGENRTVSVNDFRPEVHDSDGLLMRTGSEEWIWRPLANPPELRVSAFMDHNIRGFGLLQRDRDFANYLDMEATYHRRPTYWVEPLGDWGDGSVELVEIPTKEEVNDNIVAYWVPKTAPRAGATTELSYRITSMLADPVPSTLGRTVRTRIGSAQTPGSRSYSAETRLFVVDFAGGDLPYLTDSEPVQANVTASTGRVEDVQVMRNPETQEWRAVFRMTPDGSRASDMRLSLQHRGRRLTETWTYLWRPGLK